MSILNIANDGYFNVLIVLYKAVHEVGPIEQDKLLSYCMPEALGKSDRARNTLNRWLQLGLFEQTNAGIAIAKGWRKFPVADSDDLPRLLRRVLFNAANNENFWDSEKSLSADFSRGIAFLLAQDIYQVFDPRFENIETLEQRQVNSAVCLLQNDVRWNGLRSWGRYLGFLSQAEGLWIDPTAALGQELAIIFSDKPELDAATFVQACAEALPVLDGGRYRTQVEDRLDPTHWHQPARDDLLSTSLSRAVRHLQIAGRLTLEKRADSGDGRSLQGANGRLWSSFTHVCLSGDPR